VLIGTVGLGAFSHPEMRRLRLHTFPNLTASIRVMENGLRFVGNRTEAGAIRFELARRQQRPRYRLFSSMRRAPSMRR
jgi:hypothetical protein